MGQKKARYVFIASVLFFFSIILMGCEAQPKAVDEREDEGVQEEETPQTQGNGEETDPSSSIDGTERVLESVRYGYVFRVPVEWELEKQNGNVYAKVGTELFRMKFEHVADNLEGSLSDWIMKNFENARNWGLLTLEGTENETLYYEGDSGYGQFRMFHVGHGKDVFYYECRIQNTSSADKYTAQCDNAIRGLRFPTK